MDVYQPLPPIQGQRLTFISSKPFVPTLIETCLPHIPKTTYSTRVENQQLQLFNPPKQSADKVAREAKKARRKKAQEKKRECVMGKRKAMELGVWEFDKRLAKWEIFWPVHRMWETYMADVMGFALRPEHLPAKERIEASVKAGVGAIQAKLLKADFHGCIVTVKDCKNASRIGGEGIVVHETSNTFKVVTREDELKVYPKQGTVFSFSLPLFAPSPHSRESDPRISFDLYGNQFRYRAGERAGKKFKPKETIEL
ncbi:related to ribonuclease P protein subunit p29 [Serendipita indica DSM 11827]|uniref:Ribonuclease P protein subunit n=1 Tax=Serendipita indica (strain DSM 11827) TaxID=1109443 RepID=G4TV75_SERID|nr:related to ribonuclease P protein subunit p29 [Serendipita indica DSM 11827]